ncbi:M23 family metallopeptidase [Streptomyces sp. NBC_01803]|uniref:M23 family metallopeptidase n=1 Tax=Streptomyces sp. NBC_01803 TaxID=2975946 RepID=UPI002DDAF004|nr:M23 family metallopeptidase [Streptomyces sp. NBC_01803]WSA44949.1 M23 family metallopeptidase [Streptomyces sp. NBC_01803]
MASNRHASIEGTHLDTYGSPGTYPAYFGPKADDGETYGEWNPSEDTLLPVRGRHRVARQRGGTIARSRAVLGVGVFAAVGAGGMATANEEGASAVAGVDTAADEMATIPVLGDLLTGTDSGADTATADTATADTATADSAAALAEAPSGPAGVLDAGEALRTRLLQQADQQDANAETQAVTAAVQEAEAAAAEEAAAVAEAERAAEEERRREREEAERLEQLRASFTLPLNDYRLSTYFGESGSMWQTTHTGTDFAAPTGTPVKNVHTGTVTEAAWAGSYGYRVIVELEDGTEVWYCHLSSMSVSTGQEIVTGDTVGRVGSTGNSTGPHLHLEVRPGGDTAIDPLLWLRDKGITV